MSHDKTKSASGVPGPGVGGRQRRGRPRGGDARKTQDAAEWATAAMNHATTVEKAATAKDMAAAAEGMEMLMGTCAQCHGKYRDKAADGTYIIKKG